MDVEVRYDPRIPEDVRELLRERYEEAVRAFAGPGTYHWLLVEGDGPPATAFLQLLQEVNAVSSVPRFVMPLNETPTCDPFKVADALRAGRPS
jgi:hypothetical protein